MAALGQHSSGLVQALLGAAGASRESAAEEVATRMCLPIGGPRECGGLAVQGMPPNDSETVLDG
jgi:hypothetical protein